MFGRAGRNGFHCRAHLLYTTEQLKRVKDPFLSRFCGVQEKENCRRSIVLQGIGSRECIRTQDAVIGAVVAISHALGWTY